ncbi:unnamed protein product [Soboliphyme baturini]|uniref:Short chain dehydrogenase n=1 Tax=Soboliphyme baturini TaxID=241478 RepID=A0A183J9X2_9BILA|nr:unnamed protein product [Soboliphyme baturini]
MNNADLSSVLKCAQRIKLKSWPIHRLILTDNVYNPLHRITDDQFESTFQINYLSNFYFIILLSPILITSTPCRIIVISSEIHRLLKVAWPSNPKLTWKVLSPTHTLHMNSPLQAYLISTWCNRLMVRKLNSVLNDSAVTAYAVHPGLMRNENEHELDYARSHGRMYRIFSVLLKSTVICHTSNVSSAKCPFYRTIQRTSLNVGHSRRPPFRHQKFTV